MDAVGFGDEFKSRKIQATEFIGRKLSAVVIHQDNEHRPGETQAKFKGTELKPFDLGHDNAVAKVAQDSEVNDGKSAITYRDV